MNIKNKKRIFFTFYNINKNEKEKILLKKLEHQRKSKELISPNNPITLSNNRNLLKNLNPKSFDNLLENKKIKISQSTKTITSILSNNKNYNIYNNKFIYTCENKYNKLLNDINISKIHSNGKFKRYNLREKIFNKISEKNVILKNTYLNKELNKTSSLKLILNNNNKNNLKKCWKGLNISSHYLGNTIDNKFGVTTNKFCINKNLFLTLSQSNLKLKKNFDKNNIILEINNNGINKNNDFKNINIPNHNNYCCGNGTTNFFPRINNIINNEILYEKLMTQMTEVFNNKLKEYSMNKSNEKNIASSLKIEFLKNNLKKVKNQKLINNNKLPKYKRNSSILVIEKKNKTYEEKIKIYKPIKIKNHSNESII